jgi:hypothetical protein
MIDLVACSFPIIDPKLGVTLSNLIESSKTIFGLEVEGFHMASGVKTLNKGDTTIQKKNSFIDRWWLESLKRSKMPPSFV